MALVALTHRRLADVTAGTLTMPAVLDAIWASVSSAVTTYSDGSPRSFSGPSATGWTWNRVQVSGVTESLWAFPPGGTMSQRVVIAGRSAAPTPSPVILAPESFLASGLMIGHALEAGAFTTWNAASPFTTGRWSGYTRLGQAVTTMGSPIVVSVIETQETITLLLRVGGTAIMAAGAGAYVDPETTSAAACESDGRRYGLWTCGSTLSTTMLGTGTSGIMFVHTTSAGQMAHTYLWRPGVSVMDTARRPYLSAVMTITEMTNLAGEIAGPPIHITASSGWGGRVREMTFVRGMLYQQVVSNAGTIAGLALAPSTTTTGDCILMKY